MPTPEELGRELYDRVIVPLIQRHWAGGPPGEWVEVEVTVVYRFPDPAHPPPPWPLGTYGLGKAKQADGSEIDFDFGDIMPTVGGKAWLLTGNGHARLEDAIPTPGP